MTTKQFSAWAVGAACRQRVVPAAPTRTTHPLSHRLITLLIGAALAIGLGVVAVAQSATPASAAVCQGCVLVSAPTIGLSVTAEPGEQAVIDKDHGVAIYTPLTTAAIGGPGTVWIVGHRTTHGSVFNRVPELAVGDPIDLVDDAGTHRYIVDRLLIVSETDWSSQVDIDDMSQSRLILQTSHPDRQLRYLIEAFVGEVAASAELASPPESTPATQSVPSPVPAVARISKFGSIKSVV
jgi:hypothetical protein